MELLGSLIVGAGPCGIKAALEMKKNNLSFLIFDGGMIGGKVNIAPLVDNYPHIALISGPDLAFSFYEKLMNAGIDVLPNFITKISFDNNHFVSQSDDGKTYFSKTILFSAGCKEKQLGIPNETSYLGKGLSYCALCDARFYKDKVVAVISNYEHGFKEALYLSNFAKKVYLINQDETLKCKNKLKEDIINKDNITILYSNVIQKVNATSKIEGLWINDLKNNKQAYIAIDGLFPLIGHIPNSACIDISSLNTTNNFINVKSDLSTNIPGFFAGGDVVNRDVKQIYLAEHDGEVAFNSISKYLKERTNYD